MSPGLLPGWITLTARTPLPPSSEKPWHQPGTPSGWIPLPTRIVHLMCIGVWLDKDGQKKFQTCQIKKDLSTINLLTSIYLHEGLFFVGVAEKEWTKAPG